jgi:hypothetical protein
MGLGAAIVGAGSTLPDPTWVEVHERVGEPTRFRLRYELDIGKGDLPELLDASTDAGSTLSVIVAVGGRQQCLVKGPVHGQHIRLEQGGGGSWYEVRGADTSSVMDREARSKVWDGVKDSDAASGVLAAYGYTPDVDATQSRHEEAKHTLVQRESDLRFVRRLARRNGFMFWVTCDPQGAETAHFKPPPLAGPPLAQLQINQPTPKLQALELRFDVERPTQVDCRQVDLNTKEDIDGGVTRSPLAGLGAQDLAAITGGDARSLHLAAPGDDAGDLRARCEGALAEALWFIRGSCDARLDSLGALVRSHSLVEVSGAGKRHSGKYFVTAVRHTIDPSMHRMELELARNGWDT